MSKSALAPCLLALAFLSGWGETSAQRQVQVQKLLQSYGEVDPNDPLGKNAKAVFERLRVVADKKPQLPPSLRILNVKEEIDAIAGEDGTILVTAGVLEVCYRDHSREVGDNLLALVISHELAHLANEDFLHALAFAEAKGSWAEMDATSRARELEADRQGAVYMWMAGFDPQDLVEKEPLFQEWVSRFSPLGVHQQGTHPSVAERVQSLKKQVRTVIEELDYFSVANRLYEIGRYDLAVEYYLRFARRFPSAIVLNNIGLSHFQLAHENLAGCDKRLAMRFRTPSLLDPEHLVRGTDQRGEAPRCLDNTAFLAHKNASRESLEAAIARDPTYLPARLNLASLLVLSGDGAAALGAAQELKKIDPSSESAVLEQLAFYMVGEENPSFHSMMDTALEELRALRKRFPDSALVVYNLGQIETRSGSREDADEAWRNLLRIEPAGPYADLARNRLAIPPRRPETAVQLPPSPCSLGRISTRTERWLEGLGGERKRLETAHRGTLYSGSRFSAFEVDRNLIFVAENEPSPASLATLPKTPRRLVPTTRGAFRDFGGVGVEMVAGAPTAILYWLPTPSGRSEEGKAKPDSSR